MASPEDLAGRYALERILGRGGMGVVWAATDRVLERQVAVKVLQVGDARPESVERFRREAQYLAGLTHPNVVTVFDFGIDEHRAWLVMELLPGPTMAQLLADHGPLAIDQVVATATACASALAAAHDAGIIHRDIKPANLMLDSHGECRLLDLGIARLTGTTADTVDGLTETGMVLGTAAYVAPEVASGSTATPATDIYGLGATLYTLLTGQAPYDGGTMVGTLSQHVSAPVPHPVELRSDVPPELDALVVAMLAKEPAARPTARDVLARLGGQPSVADVTTTAVLPTTLLPPVSRQRRISTRMLLMAAAAVVVLAVVVLAVALSGGGGGKPAATPTSHSPSPTPTPTPTATPTPSPTQTPIPTAVQALDAVLAAVIQAANSGELAPKDAQDFQHRVDDLSHSLQTGKTQDLTHKIDDFEHHLDALRAKGGIRPNAYNHIVHALEGFRRVVGA